MRPPLLGLCLLAALMPAFSPALSSALRPASKPSGTGAVAREAVFPGWPAHWQGQRLNPLPLTPAEQRFVKDFPGRVAKFSLGRDVLILRWIDHQTRLLHPAADCFRGMGYTLGPRQLFRERGDIWGGFQAHTASNRLQIREQLRDAAGHSWSDVSAWYWAALLGQSQGPWWSFTRISRLTDTKIE